MSIDVTVAVDIGRAVEEVASYVVEPANESAWIRGISESTAITPGPTRAGSKAKRVAAFMGRRIEYTPEVTAYTVNEHLQMRTDAPFPMTIDYRFDRTPAGTRFTQRLRGGPTGPAAMLSPLMRLMVRRNIRRDMERLKTRMEAR